MKLRLLLSVFALFMGLAACSSSQELVVEDPQTIYEKGLAYFEKGKYSRAIEAFQEVFNFGRAHQWADDAQLYLARAYFMNKEYLLAANEFSRFIELYPTDPRAVDAEFERALCYYYLSPPYELDQTDTERAITYFRLFMTRYPNHPKAAEAGEKIEELMDKLARKLYEAGRLYERRELYEAAGFTYERVLEHYPASSWTDDALLGAVRAYTLFAEASIPARQKERFEYAIDVYLKFVQLFPQSPLLKEAEQYYQRAQRQLEQLKQKEAQASTSG